MTLVTDKTEKYNSKCGSEINEMSNLLIIILIFLGQKLYLENTGENTGEPVIEKSKITCIVFGSAVGLGLSGNSSPPAKNSFIPFTLNHHAISK